MTGLKQNYEFFLFDWDGCLIRSLPVWHEVHQEGIEAFGGTATKREIAQFLGERNIAANFGVADYEACYNYITELGHERLQNVELYPGARELLSTLHGMGRLAVLSNCPRDTLLRGIQQNHLEDCFEVILSRNDVKNGKPDPEIVHAALDALGGNPNKALLSGDSIYDILTANNAGIDSALVYHPEHASHYDLQDLLREQPTYVVNSLAQLQTLLTGEVALPN